MAQDNVVLMGVGDIGPVHEPMDAYGTLAKPILASADIRFAQCERVYSDRTIGPLSADPGFLRGNRPLKPASMSVFTDAGFNVVSLAGNHVMDYGGGPLQDTIELFNRNGILTAGAGANLEEARRPAIIERKGVRVAFLAYCSLILENYEAGPNKPGVVPLRAHTSYEPINNQLGMPVRVVTVPYEEDLQGMVDDIKKAKQTAHVVVVSQHWGLHYIPRMICDYQNIAAKAAFDAGADLILGHHPHIPKAIESQNGKVCFYSLGNFIFTTDTSKKPGFAASMKRMGVVPDLEEAPLCPHSKESKHSLIAKAVLSSDGIKKVSFLPVQIDKQLRPEVLNHGDPRFDTVVNYIDWASEGYGHKFTVEGNQVVVHA